MTSEIKRTILFIILSIITLGIFTILSYLFPSIRAKVKYRKCRLYTCSHILIEREDEGVSVFSIIRVNQSEYDPSYRWFEYMCYRYVWMANSQCFNKIRYSIENKGFKEIYDTMHKGLTSDEANRNLNTYGDNRLYVEVPSYFKLLYTEIFHPFYIFQAASIAIWIWDDYYIYSAIIFIMSIASAIVSVIQTKRNRVQLAELCHKGSEVTILRDGNFVDRIDSSQIANGDIVEILPNSTVPCDLLLLEGSCIVNESSLTGESIPILKTSIPRHEEDLFRKEIHEKYILFNGTKVLQCKNERVLGLTIATGFSTSKGELIRSILFPKPTKFKFYRDSMKFVFVLGCIAFIGCTYSIIRFAIWKAPPAHTAKRALDLVTIAVPPALPIAMTIGTAFAITRLKERKIYCISPQIVNVCGRIDTMCFDKTGTLTEDSLDVYGVKDVKASSPRFTKKLKTYCSQLHPLMQYAFASCHSLIKHEDEILGDPLEMRMVELTGWSIKDFSEENIMVSPDKKQEIVILKQFEFSSMLQRMSVITSMHNTNGKQSNLDKYTDVTVFSKGSSEKIKSLCDPKTIPPDHDEVLSYYTYQGMRVISIAYKYLPGVQKSVIMDMKRNEAEQGLTFLGFLILQNNLKEDTTMAINQLKNGNLENIMVTGDNEYTAVSMARKCNLVSNDDSTSVFLLKLNENYELIYEYVKNIREDEEGDLVISLKNNEENGKFNWSNPNHVLAVNGKSFCFLRENAYDLYLKVLRKGRIYARMTPLDKSQLIRDLQDQLGLCVGMCGDGANDLGALKQSDVGLSLSEAEASVAAPFTSKNPSISSVVSLLIEGRCALATSIQCYKFMACYSMIQLLTSLLLYSTSYKARIEDYQFLYIDGIIILSITFLMGRTRPRTTLGSRRPVGSLVSRSIILSIAFQMLIHAIIAIGYYLYNIYYWIPSEFPNWDSEDIRKHLVTAMFLLGNFQYVATGLAFSIGKPYRKAVWNNFPFFLILILLIFCNTFLVLVPPQWLMNLLEMHFITTKAKFTILGLSFLNIFLVWFVEKVIIVNFIQKRDEHEPPKLSVLEDEL